MAAPRYGVSISVTVVNVVGIGLDLVELAEFETSLSSPAFVQKVFTEAEQSYCAGQKYPHLSYAGKFAVKEAVMKVLGAGIYQGVWFTQIEILNNAAGKPHLQLHRKAYQYAVALAIVDWHISITHTSTTAAAVVLALSC